MKKYNEIIDFLALSNELRVCEEVDEQEAWKVKCCWLQLELRKRYSSIRFAEWLEAYEWIRNAPVAEWNVMLECLTKSNCQTVGEAKDLYSSLW